MNIKEAFRYQNFLDKLLSTTTDYLSYDSNVTKTTQEHLRKKANPDAEDETLDVTKDREIDCSVNTLVDFCQSIITEKENLGKAIDVAKSDCGLDIDNSVAINKKKQDVARIFSRMSNIKAKEKIKEGTAYKFNVEGNQTIYNYDVKEVSVIDFDRNKVRAIAKKLLKESDEVSANLDKIMVDKEVKYTPEYDVNDTYEDVLEQFSNRVVNE